MRTKVSVIFLLLFFNLIHYTINIAMVKKKIIFAEKAHGWFQVSNWFELSSRLEMCCRTDAFFHVSISWKTHFFFFFKFYLIICGNNLIFCRLPRASDAPVMSGGSIFSWGTKFKYTGRTEREVLESGLLRKVEPPIQRSNSTSGLRRKASSVPATPSTPSQDCCEIR